MIGNLNHTSNRLHVAAYNSDLGTVIELLANGSNPNACDEKGFTPLHWCAFRGLVGTQQHLVAEALLQAGANPNACTNAEDCILNMAIESGNQSLVEVLIRNGADVNMIANGVTPLMTAARVGDKDMIDMLLQAGADPKAEVGGFQAYDYATHYGHEEIASILKRGV